MGGHDGRDPGSTGTGPTDPRRRTFLAVAAGTGCAVVGAAAVPAAVVVAAPATEAGPSGIKFTLGKIEDFPLGVPKKIAIVGDEVDAWTRAEKRKLGAVWVTRTGDRALRVLSVTCPHLGCAIDVTTAEDGAANGFNCACHDSNFALDGARKDGPSPRGMDPLEVEIDGGGEVTVLFKRFKLGGEERQEA
jgi:Rieske Fe-S protein